MGKSSTPSFIATIPLIVNSKQEKELRSRFQAGRQFYNAMLNEAMVRMNLVKNSALYKERLRLPKGKKRNDEFKQARQAYRYSEYDLHAYATLVAKKSKWIADKIDSNTQQKLATRALQASEKVLIGRADKVRYKVPTRFRSMEGKTNKQGMRWKDNQLVWGKLTLTPILDWNNPVIAHALNSPVKYVRILWKAVHGKRRWYCQLICEGVPYQKHQNYVSDGIVGLDLNVSNVAFVADNEAGLLPFAEKVPTFQKEIARLQRQMERSRRASNPDNYKPDSVGRKGRKTVIKKGLPKKGRRKWNKSNNYKQATAAKRELERRKSEYTKSQNRRLVNTILRSGKHIKTERVSVKGWQKIWGKAISVKSPGFFQSELKRKAERAGGSFYQFSTSYTALSQTHLTGERIQKSLSERVHRDKSGVVMHRDLMSAFLSRHVYDDKLSLQNAQSEYSSLEPSLLRAWQQHQQSANRVVETPWQGVCTKVGAVIAPSSRSVATQKSPTR